MANYEHAPRRKPLDEPQIPYYERKNLEVFGEEIDGKIRLLIKSPVGLPFDLYEFIERWGCTVFGCEYISGGTNVRDALGEYVNHNADEHGSRWNNHIVKLWTPKWHQSQSALLVSRP